ncbi:hypothetical protein BgiMline_011937 [Biomphalaria glabrata]|nr:hypothetical protein BgiMline_030545 [Biomphalaria glabrata]
MYSPQRAPGSPTYPSTKCLAVRHGGSQVFKHYSLSRIPSPEPPGETIRGSGSPRWGTTTESHCRDSQRRGNPRENKNIPQLFLSAALPLEMVQDENKVWEEAAACQSKDNCHIKS